MIDEISISLVTPENAAQFAATLSGADIPPLVARLDSTEDKIRYPAFLLLRERSALAADVYPFWDALDEKLTHDTNSYQRSIGGMLLAANARHDCAGKLRSTLPRYIALLNDPKADHGAPVRASVAGDSPRKAGAGGRNSGGSAQGRFARLQGHHAQADTCGLSGNAALRSRDCAFGGAGTVFILRSQREHPR